MEILILLAIAPFLLIFLLCNKNKESSPKTRNPPGPPRLPCIGNLHQLDISCLHRNLWQLSKEYGPLMSLKLGSIPTLVVSSARMAEEVLKTQDLAFCSRPRLVGLQKISYNGVDIALAPYSQEWREMRKICVLHLLSAKRIQHFRPICEDEVSRMIANISKDAELSNATNLSETVVSVISTMICRIAFGKRVDEGGQERRRFDGLLRETQLMISGFFFSDYFPWIGWVDKLSGMQSRLESIIQTMDSFYQELIDEHLDPNRLKSMDGDIIDLMFQLREDRSTSFNITVDRIKGLLMVYLYVILV